MNLDEIIAKLQEAKDHCVDGRTVVEVLDSDSIYSTIDAILYDNKSVIIKTS